MSTAILSEDRLRAELDRRRSGLRPPAVVMQPAMMGAARLTRYSFSRTMLRRAVQDGWQARCVRFDMDAKGRGEAVYEVRAAGYRFSFVAFTSSLDESEHTDRVIAQRWEISAALIEDEAADELASETTGGLSCRASDEAASEFADGAAGEFSDEMLDLLRREVPLQERGRLDSRVLVLTRGNRSVRFFEYLVDVLAGGEQPDPLLVADAGYILRSTAFYANGKYGMRSFEGYPPDHPLRVPYRAQFVCAWMFRELGYDLVEHCARAKGGSTAVAFDERWRRFFGLGNATGLGLVPFAFKHPRMIHAWVAIREMALSDVRAMPGTAERVACLEEWIDRAHAHFVHGTGDNCDPFFNALEVASVVDRIRDAFQDCRADAEPFDALYRWSENQDAESTEMVVSLLLELHDADDDLIDEMLIVEEHDSLDPATTAGELRALLESRFSWLDGLNLDAQSADSWWWVISDNNEEPRRTPRDRLDPANRDMAIDVALRLRRLQGALDDYDDDAPVYRLLAERPEHRLAAQRLSLSDRPYGEPRDNACSQHYLPLMLQRFQLAMYGMDNFKPKSTDWLRVTLFQGAPRLSDLDSDTRDDWVLPPRPERPQ